MTISLFDEDGLIRYLRQINETEKLLFEREQLLTVQLKRLDIKKLPENSNYTSIEERILEYAFGGRGADDEGSSGNHYNPDALYRAWEKIYKPYEIEKKRILRDYEELQKDKIILGCVKTGIYRLEKSEKDLIENVYIGGNKVASYCRMAQVGHSTYGKIKKSALKHLLKISNDRLITLFDEERPEEYEFEKNTADGGRSGSSSADSDRDCHDVVSIRRLHKGEKKV